MMTPSDRWVVFATLGSWGDVLPYLAIALGFLHQLIVGTDFIHDPVAVAYWIGLYVVTVGLVLVFRVLAPIRLSLRHRLRADDGSECGYDGGRS